MSYRVRLHALPTLVALFTIVAAAAQAQPAPAAPALRPPAVPLVAVDPYFSIWSPADRLTDAATVHWTGRPHPLNSLVRIDGEPFRIMGATPADTAAMPQTSLAVHPTRTVYTFADKRVRITLTFLTPALAWDLDLLSRPVTYLTWDIVSATGSRTAWRSMWIAARRSRSIRRNNPSASTIQPSKDWWARWEHQPVCRAATMCGSTGAMATWRRPPSQAW
jgi:hypothetical protein